MPFLSLLTLNITEFLLLPTYRFVMNFDSVILQHAFQSEFLSTMFTSVKKVFWMWMNTFDVFPKLFTCWVGIQKFWAFGIFWRALWLKAQVVTIQDFVLFWTRINCSSATIPHSVFVNLKKLINQVENNDIIYVCKINYVVL